MIKSATAPTDIHRRAAQGKGARARGIGAAGGPLGTLGLGPCEALTSGWLMVIDGGSCRLTPVPLLYRGLCRHQTSKPSWPAGTAQTGVSSEWRHIIFNCSFGATFSFFFFFFIFKVVYLVVSARGERGWRTLRGTYTGDYLSPPTPLPHSSPHPYSTTPKLTHSSGPATMRFYRQLFPCSHVCSLALVRFVEPDTPLLSCGNGIPF